jgi:hypothetical protein
VHAETLHGSRNSAARMLEERGCEWVIFLDADDELDEDYVRNMALHTSLDWGRSWPVFYPSTLAVVDGVPADATHLHEPKNILMQNYINIGACHKIEMHRNIGGFEDWPVLEDWAYWAKAWVHGALFEPVHGAVYCAHIDSDRPGRNVSQPPEVIAETTKRIREKYAQ